MIETSVPVYQIIRKILKTHNIDWIKGKPYYSTPEMWCPCEEYYQYIYEHYMKYGEVPDEASLYDQFSDYESIMGAYGKYDVEESYESLLSRMDEYATLMYQRSEWNARRDMQEDGYRLNEAFKEMAEASNNYILQLNSGIVVGTDARDHDPFAEEEKSEYISTGFSDIDSYLGGIDVNGELVGLFANTNQGKTWILLKMAIAAYLEGKNVIFVTTEMPKQQIWQRFVTLSQNISNNSVRKHKVDNISIEKYNIMLESHDNYFRVADTSDMDLVVNNIESVVASQNCDIIYIDGIKFVRPCNENKSELEYQRLERVSKQLSELSIKIGVPIVVTMQGNRDGEKNQKASNNPNPPKLAELASSYGIAHSCSKIISLVRVTDTLKLLLAKSRTSDVNIMWSYKWNIDMGTFDFISQGYLGDNDEEQKNTNVSGNRNTGVKDILCGRRNSVRNQQPLKRKDNNNIF